MKQELDNRRISEMRNLGPACETDMNAVGIMTAHDLIVIGPEQAFRQVLEGRTNMGQSNKSLNALYLYAIYGAIHDIDWREIPEHKKSEFKKLTAAMRKSGELD